MPRQSRASAVLPLERAYAQEHNRSYKTKDALVSRAATTEEGTSEGLEELNQDSFYPYLEGAGDRLVVVDFYTDWCGPCKVMLPLLEDFAQEMTGKADIVKFNCNARNKDLGKELNIRVAPTFHIYRKSNKIAELTGAKFDELKELVQQNL